MLRGLQVFVSGIALAGFTLAGAGVASAQEPAKPVLTLEGDAAVVIVLDQARQDGRLRDRHRQVQGGASPRATSPTRKEQLAGMKFFKSPTAMGGNTAYIFRVDPVVKGEEYDITRVINEVFPSEVTDMFNKYKEAYAGRQIIVLNKIP